MVQGSLENFVDLNLQNRQCRWVRLTKSSYPDDLRRILKQADFRVFRGVEFLLTPTIEIFKRISKVSK